MTGPWAPRTHSHNLYDHYYYTPVDEQHYTATWSPYLIGGGYEVFALWRKRAERSTSVPYKITHEGGTQIVYVNQRNDGCSWHSLGTFTFNTGNVDVTMDVEVDELDEETVSADAVKFVPDRHHYPRHPAGALLRLFATPEQTLPGDCG